MECGRMHTNVRTHSCLCLHTYFDDSVPIRKYRTKAQQKSHAPHTHKQTCIHVYNPGVKYRKEPNKKVLVRVEASSKSSSEVAAQKNSLNKQQQGKGAKKSDAERVRIGGVMYEKSADGSHLVKCR